MSRPSILIMEDDPNNAVLLAGHLMRSGFYVSSISDGQAALRAIKEETPPALVLLDQHLPFCDGFTVMTAIQRSATWAKTPVILLSSSTTEKDETTAFNLGAYDFVTKPLRPEALLARIRRCLNVNPLSEM